MRQLLEDAATSTPAEAPAAIALLLKRERVRYVTFRDWQRIANAERRNGGRKNRRGLKFGSVEAMLNVLEPPSSL